jgi:hypothetical protein
MCAARLELESRRLGPQRLVVADLHFLRTSTITEMVVRQSGKHAPFLLQG